MLFLLPVGYVFVTVRFAGKFLDKITIALTVNAHDVIITPAFKTQEDHRVVIETLKYELENA